MRSSESTLDTLQLTSHMLTRITDTRRISSCVIMEKCRPRGGAQFPFGSGVVGCRLRHETRVRLSRVIGSCLRRDPKVHASVCLDGGSSHCGAGTRERTA